MSHIEILGFVSAFLTTLSFLPQALQVIKTKDTSSLSLAMYSLFTIGVAGWLVYGFYIKDTAVVIANMITLVLSSIILTIKVRNELSLKRDTQEKACIA